MDSTHVTPRPVVVGVDGSPGSARALTWAARQARLTNAPLQAVMAWSWPDMYGGGFGGVPYEVDLAADSGVVLKQMVADLGDDAPPDGVQGLVLEGHPSQVLLHQAEHASLLVVGSRGHGAFSGMLLGSVSQHCVSNAGVPVVVVRAEEAG
jgi:nucleotide-binding universal stress UspA family protein